jgi:hypothetical protein
LPDSQGSLGRPGEGVIEGFHDGEVKNLRRKPVLFDLLSDEGSIRFRAFQSDSYAELIFGRPENPFVIFLHYGFYRESGRKDFRPSMVLSDTGDIVTEGNVLGTFR